MLPHFSWRNHEGSDLNRLQLQEHMELRVDPPGFSLFLISFSVKGDDMVEYVLEPADFMPYSGDLVYPARGVIKV